MLLSIPQVPFLCLLLLVIVAPAPAQVADPGAAHADERDAGELAPATEPAARPVADAAGLRLLDAQDRMFPFVPPWDDASESPVNVSFLNHVPAGKFGAVTAGDDGELYIGQGETLQKIKFLGTNLNFASIYAEHEDADAVAGRMAKFGFNVVRFHHTDTHGYPRGIWKPRDGNEHNPTSEIDPRSLDRLHYFVAALKKRGVYSNINLLVNRRFNDDPTLPEEILKVGGGKPRHVIGYWYKPHRELQKEYARQLLTPVNPHTGMSLADDPAVAFVEVINEHGLVNYFFMERYEPQLADMPEPFLNDLRQQWNDWLNQDRDLRQKLGQKTRGEELFAGEAPVPTLEQFREEWAQPQREAWITFLYETERDYYADMREYFQEDLGVKALVMGSTAGSSTPLLQAASTDVIDQHVYYDNPKWRGRTWDFGSLDWHIDNKSNIGGYVGGRLRWVAGYQVEGKPFSVTEYNTAAPNMFAGEAPLYLATMGAIQGWDAIYLFAYTHNAEWDRHRITGLDTADHPAKMANVPIAAMLFRRGDLSTPAPAAVVSVLPAAEVEIILRKGSGWNLSNAYYHGAEGEESVLGPVLIRPSTADAAGGRAEGSASVDGLKERERFVSDGDELVWDRTDRDRSFVTLDTPRTKSVYGMIAGRRFVLGDATFDVGDTTTGGGTISLSVTEGESLDEGEWRRAILVATARAENTGMKWKRVETAKGVGWELESWGKTPTVVEAVSATVSLSRVRLSRKVRVFVLDERGQRAGEVAVERTGENIGSFRIGEPHHTLWYEVVWER